MSRAIRLAQKSLTQQREALLELEAYAKSIDRGDQMIADLKIQMEGVAIKHKDRKTTVDDIAYLEDLLRCARKKVAWEKKMESLRKGAQIIFEKVSKVINDPTNPPNEQTRANILQSLQNVKSSMERLDKAQRG